MKLIVFTASTGYQSFLQDHLNIECEFSSKLLSPSHDPEFLYLLHLSSLNQAGIDWLQKFAYAQSTITAVCSDRPSLREMLECVRTGTKAYCNSHMAGVHFEQMLRLISQGQSWFPPAMLEETFKLAHQASTKVPESTSLEALTEREKQIAEAIGTGKSNREVAEFLGISEPTVKTHLTNIFKKLDVKDRVSLALLLK
ncbi:MAG: response regulator transcription factor [Pseudomonadota bacterium]